MRVDRQLEKHIPHRRVAGDDDLVDRTRVDGKFLNRATKISHQRALQRFGAVFRVVLDPRHHVRAAEALRIFKRGISDDFAGFEIQQAHDDRRGTKIDREAMQRAGASVRSPRRREECDRRPA